MRRTQEEFAKTAERVDSVEKLVKEGMLRQSAQRDSLTAHSNPNGLQRLAQDPYQNDGNSTFGLNHSMQDATSKDGTVKNAQSLPPLPPPLKRLPTKVPDQVRKEMIELGFRPSSVHEDRFEYESDSIEKYEMISNEFNFEELRESERFAIK